MDSSVQYFNIFAVLINPLCKYGREDVVTQFNLKIKSTSFNKSWKRILKVIKKKKRICMVTKLILLKIWTVIVFLNLSKMSLMMM